MNVEEEEAFLAPFFDKAKEGGILVVSEIKNALDQRLGRNVALASAYNLLHRHDWRKLAPDKRHPKSDANAQEVWKKNFPTLLPNQESLDGRRADPADVMDEARFGRISDTRRCWCPKPIRPVCYAMVSQEYTYAYAAASVSDGTMDSLILPHVNGDCMQIFLDRGGCQASE